jgi:hypothetical protein
VYDTNVLKKLKKMYKQSSAVMTSALRLADEANPVIFRWSQKADLASLIITFPTIVSATDSSFVYIRITHESQPVINGEESTGQFAAKSMAWFGEHDLAILLRFLSPWCRKAFDTIPNWAILVASSQA